jgi:hypothetical protein
VGKAFGRFSSLKSGFLFHRPGRDGRIGLLRAHLTPGPGSAKLWKQGRSLIFKGHSAKIAASGHGPTEPGLTDFNDVGTGWADF